MDRIQVQYEADLKKIKADFNQLEAEMKGVDQTAKQSAGNLEKNFNNAGKSANSFASTLGKLTPILAGVFAVDRIIAFGQSIIDTTAKFQKFEAILTNTLGSNSAAKEALKFIQDFAATTPFQVDEITEAFIKLANRGVVATKSQMTSIGDIAASLGKDFGQVVEAIADVNNTERWNEIGIKATTAGNKVSLSFKGTTIEVDKTVAGVTGAIEKLGKLNGVAGTTSSISGTLAGQISNLEDTITDLKNTIGQALAPAISFVVNGIKNLVGSAKEIKILGFAFEALIAPIKVAFDLLGEAYTTIIQPIVTVLKAAFVPLLEALNKAFGGVGGSVSELVAKFNPLIITIRLALLPLQLLAYGLSLLTPIIEEYIVPAFQSFVVLLAETKNGIADFVNSVTQSGLAKSVQKTFGFEIGKVGKTNIEELKKSFVKNTKDMGDSTKELDKIRKEAEEKAKAGNKELTEFEKTQIAEREKARKAELRNFIKAKDEAIRIQKELFGFEPPQRKMEADFTKVTKEESKKRHSARVEEMKKFKSDVTDPIIKNGNEAAEAQTKKDIEEADKRRDNQLLAVDTVQTVVNDIAGAIEESQQRKTDADLVRVQQEAANEIAMLESRKQRGLITEEQLANGKRKILEESKRKEAAIKTKDAQNDKKLALFKIAVDTGAAVVKQLTVTPYPAAIPFLIAIGALAATQAAIVATRPIPKFKKGIERFKGAGTNTSDSNIVAISNNESVVTAQGTIDNPGAVDAMNKGYFKKYIRKNYVLPELQRIERQRRKEDMTMSNNMAGMVNLMKSGGFDDDRMVRVLKDIRSKKTFESAKDIAKEITRANREGLY